HAAALLSVVPVLPATGWRTLAPTDEAVGWPPQLPPPCGWSPTGHRAASVAARATSAESRRSHLGVAPGNSLPVRSRIFSTGSGWQYLPSAAIVAYALAISSGVVFATPRVNEPQRLACSGSSARSLSLPCQTSPSFSAIFTALSAPTGSTSWTKYVLTDM